MNRIDQGYGEKFARIYNLRWTAFAGSVAPAIHSLYEKLPIAASNRRLLDVACGTGQLVSWFAEKGYTCTGLDASEHMLAYARRNAAAAVKAGRVDFVVSDASRFHLDRGYGLVVSTFDALNHLPDRDSLASCFSCVFQALAPGGCFIFDLNTAKGLRLWNSISVEETDELFILNRGIHAEAMGRAYVKITGFIKADRGMFERFEQTAYNTVFSMREVEQDLDRSGFRNAYFTTAKDLAARNDDPEDLTRAFIVTRKHA